MAPPSLISSPSETSPPRDEVSTTAWRGSPQQGLERLQMTLVPYGIGIAAAYAGFALGALPLWSAHIMAVWCSTGLLLFWLLLRTGLTTSWRDPSLVFPQLLFGCLSVALSYALIDAARGLALLWLCLLMLFDIHRLTTSQLVLASMGSITLMGIANLFHDQLHGHDIDLFSEWIGLGTGAIVMPVIYQVSFKSYQMRTKMLRQRAILEDTVARLASASVRDALTGLFNRGHMQNLLDEEVRRLRRTGQAFCVALIDLDHFKQINDRHGHAVGDAALQTFALVAQTELAAIDTLARWGGEEFLLLMPETELPEATQRMSVLQQRVQEHDWSSLAPGLSLSFSAGLCEPDRQASVHLTLEQADRALYQAKAQGRARTVLADPT